MCFLSIKGKRAGEQSDAVVGKNNANLFFDMRIENGLLRSLSTHNYG